MLFRLLSSPPGVDGVFADFLRGKWLIFVFCGENSANSGVEKSFLDIQVP